MNVPSCGSPEVRPPNFARLAFSVTHAPACLMALLEVSSPHHSDERVAVLLDLRGERLHQLSQRRVLIPISNLLGEIAPQHRAGQMIVEADVNRLVGHTGSFGASARVRRRWSSEVMLLGPQGVQGGGRREMVGRRRPPRLEVPAHRGERSAGNSATTLHRRSEQIVSREPALARRRSENSSADGCPQRASSMSLPARCAMTGLWTSDRSPIPGRPDTILVDAYPRRMSTAPALLDLSGF
jgi:hypothetical protein